LDFAPRRQRDWWVAVDVLGRVELEVVGPSVDCEQHHAQQRVLASLDESFSYQ
jgi:hypothetical protein